MRFLYLFYIEISNRNIYYGGKKGLSNFLCHKKDKSHGLIPAEEEGGGAIICIHGLFSVIINLFNLRDHENYLESMLTAA